MIFLFVFAGALCGGLVSSEPAQHYDLADSVAHFEQFMQTYNKQYSSAQEKSMRFTTFVQNLIEINKKNDLSGTAVHGINQFTDLTPAEFQSTYLGLRPSLDDSECTTLVVNYTTFTAPDAFDWRDKNVVTPVKDQGVCGSCWAFSTTGNLEGQYAIRNKKLVSFSESQLVDCDKLDKGCDGGIMTRAIIYVKENGIETEESYPYVPVTSDCQYNKDKVVAHASRCTLFSPKTEDELKETLFRVGPLAIAVDAESIQHYKSGILPKCEAGQVNHGVLLVGYGVENGQPFWTIKNSWSAKYGEKGYVRIKRNENACNILKSGCICSATF